MAAISANDLKRYDDAFSEADEPVGGGRVPDGDYIFKVDSVEMKDYEGTPYLNWCLLVDDDGEYNGRTAYLSNWLSDGDNAARDFGYLKHNLRIAGIPVDHKQFKMSWCLSGETGEKDKNGKPIPLPTGYPTLQNLLDVRIAGTIKTRKNDPAKYNVYLNGKVDESAGEAFDDAPAGDGEAFNPFADA